MISPRPNAQVVIKYHYSAFANPELDDLLKRRSIHGLLLAGVATDTCGESTGREAYFIDDYVTLAANCCAGALESERFECDYGAVVNSADVIQAWQRSEALTTRPHAACTG